jgi:nucleotide-binding universal stress UspA family protein
MSWLPKKTVLVPTDFSEPSVDAVNTALELVENPSDVHVLYVLEELEHSAPAVLFGDFDEAARKQRAGEFLDQFLQRYEITGVTEVIRIGNPGLEITEYAKESRSDLIVIPSHGHHGLRRILLGSVAERVLRHAECPTLVLRRPDAD